MFFLHTTVKTDAFSPCEKQVASKQERSGCKLASQLWSLLVLPVPVWASSRNFGFISHSKDKKFWLSSNSKLPKGVNVNNVYCWCRSHDRLQGKQ